MNAVLGDGFETAESKHSGGARSAHKACGVFDAVVIRDRDNLDSGFATGFDNRPVVFVFRREGGFPVVPFEIGEWVDLQGAVVKPCTVWKLQSGLHTVRQRVRRTGPSLRSFFDLHYC